MGFTQAGMRITEVTISSVTIWRPETQSGKIVQEVTFHNFMSHIFPVCSIMLFTPYKGLHYHVQCVADIRIETADFWLDSVKYFYQDVDVELAFNVSVHLIGQQLPGASPPHFSFEFLLSNQDNVLSSGSFNGGNGAVVVGDQSAVVFNEDTLEGKSNALRQKKY